MLTPSRVPGIDICDITPAVVDTVRIGYFTDAACLRGQHGRLAHAPHAARMDAWHMRSAGRTCPPSFLI